MSAMHPQIALWCAAAAAELRFRPDRRAVYDELAAHLEEEAAALVAAGLSEDEAAARAVARMGDARETGAALGRVHSPLLGWAWTASRWLLRLTVTFAFILLVMEFLSLPRQLYGFVSDLADPMPLLVDAGGAEAAPYEQVRVLRPDCTARVDDYLISVPRAELWRAAEPNDTFGGRALLCLRVRTLHAPWLPQPLLVSFLTAADSAGNVYPARSYLARDASSLHVVNSGPQSNLDEYCYIALADEDAAWVELRYDRFGTRFALRVALTGGEAA